MEVANKENGAAAMQDVSKTVKLMQKLDRVTDDESDAEPLSPYTSWLPRYNEETEEELLDLPEKLMTRPGAGKQFQDLQRCSVQVGQGLREAAGKADFSLTFQEEDTANTNTESNANKPGAHGELFVRSGFLFKTWKRRYGSIVEHSYFGPVLFLFKYDVDGNIEVKHSDMIALSDTIVTMGKNKKAGTGFRCEFFIKTAKKKYQFAAADSRKRDYWMKNI